MAGNKTQVWNSAFEATPAGTDRIRDGDDRIRELKSAIQERIAQEHEMSLVEGGAQPRQGLHKAGSARGWYQATAPSALANGDALGTSDAGAIWIDSDTKVPHMWNGSAWVALVADDALKVSGYGIGVDVPDPLKVDLNTVVKGGKYYAEYAVARNFPTGITASGFLDVTALAVGDGSTTNITVQYFVPYNNLRTFIRKNSSSGWSAWYEVFNTLSDGNGGQPPAPKPKAYDGNQGSWALSQFGSTVQGKLAAGGVWAYMAWLRVIATGAWTDYGAGVAAGASNILTPASGSETLILQWRVT